jgi:hypothetical protein
LYLTSGDVLEKINGDLFSFSPIIDDNFDDVSLIGGF